MVRGYDAIKTGLIFTAATVGLVAAALMSRTASRADTPDGSRPDVSRPHD
ncbi:hypothetical protein MXD63_31760 [Frankia sp. Cpl3]|nr:hypothetical protein [Parafrankia colletiae]MCK9904605.1 hypothetical protein [Frankia sp. Cpl3]